MRGALTGLVAYARVVPLLTRLSLWRYVALTAIVSIGVALAVVGVAVGLASAIPSGHGSGAWPPVGVLRSLAFVATVALGLVAFKHLVLIAAGPWMGKVAERVLDYYGHAAAPGHSAAGALGRSVRLNLRLLARELLWSLACLALGVVPVVGLASPALLFVVQSYFVGAGALDYSLERERDYAGSLVYFRQNRARVAGVGAGFVLLLLLGIGFLLAPAWSAAAGAYAYAHDDSSPRRATRTPSPRSDARAGTRGSTRT